MTLPPVISDSVQRLNERISAANALALGANGFDLYSDTSAHTGTWGVIEVLTTATFTTLTVANTSGTLIGVAFQPGTRLFGVITAIRLTSGSVIAYRSA